jgi:phosphoribosylanthranilate isomerase
VTAEQVKKILARVGSDARAVGVFVNALRDEVLRTAEACGLYAVQLHGDEQAADFQDTGLRVWRALRVGPNGPQPAPEDWAVERYVVDAAAPGIYGGTGVEADWAQARLLARCMPVLLAGGLTSETVAEAIRDVRPRGVDVVSGVESVPGRKDRRKMRRFVDAVRGAEPAPAV